MLNLVILLIMSLLFIFLFMVFAEKIKDRSSRARLYEPHVYGFIYHWEKGLFLDKPSRPLVFRLIEELEPIREDGLNKLNRTERKLYEVDAEGCNSLLRLFNSRCPCRDMYLSTREIDYSGVTAMSILLEIEYSTHAPCPLVTAFITLNPSETNPRVIEEHVFC